MNRPLLFLLITILLSLQGFAQSFEYNGLKYSVSSGTDKTCEVARNENVFGDIIIPESVPYDGITYSVTSIRMFAFDDCSGLTSVEIPNSVVSIGNYAFYGCSALTNIEIPNSVVSIGDYAFDGCRGLASVTIPSSVIFIGREAFYGCNSLTKVEISDIEAWCKIDFNSYASSPVYYGGSLYLNSELITDLVIPESITSIGAHSFTGCGGLTSVTIPNSVTSIGACAFQSCHGLKSVTIGNSVISIGEASFNGCSALTSVEIPNSVTSIGDRGFQSCDALTNVSIGNSVTSIGYQAFENCSRLTSIEIPNSVTSIGWSAFNGCSGLTSVTIPNSVTSIGERAFYGCSGLTSVKIPNSVTSIEYFTFYGCSGLTNLTIGNSVTSIGGHAFRDCRRLTSVEIPNSVISIGDYAFRSCSGLTSVEIPNSVTSIGENAFDNCGLTSVEIPNSVTSIENSVFYGCRDLTSVTIPESVTSIGESAFAYCRGLTSVTIPSSVTSIGAEAFYGCSGLTQIQSLSENPPMASAYAFDGLYSKPLYVPAQSVALYKVAPEWEKFNNIEPLSGGATGIVLNKTELTMSVGEEETLLATITPENATDKTVTWESSDSGVATVSQEGLVTAVSPGTAVITASDAYGHNAIATVTVKEDDTPVEVPATGISITPSEPQELKVGESLQLTATVSPENATDKTVTWESSDSGVATVNQEGLVTTVSPGTAVITASDAYGHNAFAIITVIAAEDNGVETIFPEAEKLNILTLDGILIKKDATQEDIDALPPGIYIIGGKKVIIR